MLMTYNGGIMSKAQIAANRAARNIKEALRKIKVIHYFTKGMIVDLEKERCRLGGISRAELIRNIVDFYFAVKRASKDAYREGTKEKSLEVAQKVIDALHKVGDSEKQKKTL